MPSRSEFFASLFSKENMRKRYPHQDTALSAYLQDIGKLPLLTAVQEAELLARVARGDGDARQRLVEANLRLVMTIVARFQGRGPASSHSKKPYPLHDRPAEEWQLLGALQAQGVLGLDQASTWNGQAYLEARKIPLEIAHRFGVAYVAPGTAEQYGEWVRPWENRLIFPLSMPDGEAGFAGRLIVEWQVCCDAATHQARLRALGHEPWRKTGSPGWFWEPQRLPRSEPVVVVDGPFDRLAVLAAGGFEPGEVVALVGQTFQPAWFSGVSAVLFALNRSQNSKAAIDQLKQQLAWNGGVREGMCRTRDGNNWSECWRREGDEGLEILYAEHARLTHGV